MSGSSSWKEITFGYRDSADGGRTKRLTVSAFEFIRRFLLHILPKGFVKIRHVACPEPLDSARDRPVEGSNRKKPWPGVTGNIPLSAALDDDGEVFLAKRENGRWNYYSRSR